MATTKAELLQRKATMIAGLLAMRKIADETIAKVNLLEAAQSGDRESVAQALYEAMIARVQERPPRGSYVLAWDTETEELREDWRTVADVAIGLCA